MSVKTRKMLRISRLFAIAMTGILLGTCDKEPEYYISQEDFVNALKGDWHVHQVTWGNIFSLTFNEDINELCYHHSDQRQCYKFNDPDVRNIANVEMMQNWTITENHMELYLEARDLCKRILHYKVAYSNNTYSYGLSGVNKEVIVWDMSFVSQDTTINFYDIRFYTKKNPPTITLSVNDSNNEYYYVVHRGKIEF